jgi:hypothetical protein
MIFRKYGLSLLLTIGSPLAFAHHGVAGVGAAALEGPGAPVESASSSVLPEGRTLLYGKLDHASFKRRVSTNTEVDYNQYWMGGIGHGVTPWFSAYLFAPYNKKVDTAEPAGAATAKFDTKGATDISVMGQLGFKYDKGLQLVPANESLDDLEDWHFSVFLGTTVPTGNPNLKDRAGNINPGKSTSFGKPSSTLGFTASKMLTKDLTFNTELSTIRFREHRYASDTNNPAGLTTRFGKEDRLNVGLAYRLYTNPEQRFRLDASLEVQYLALGRDRQNGADQSATGGKIMYLLPGVRFYKDSLSFAFGIKTPYWTKLNEATDQQGAEGKEKYRLIFSVSTVF